MRIRPYQSTDHAAVEKIHAGQDFGYKLPDLDHPIMLTKLVVEDDDQNIVQAAFLRITSEAYLMLDNKYGTPEQRQAIFLALHEAVRQDAQRKGLEDVHAFLPPRISRRFGLRLQTLGWQRDWYEPWVRKTEGATWPAA